MKKRASLKTNEDGLLSQKGCLTVMLVGVIARATQGGRLLINLTKPLTIVELIEYLRTNHGIEMNYIFSKNNIRMDETLSLVIVNGREINTLSGLETKVKGGDSVAFIPVAHGG